MAEHEDTFRAYRIEDREGGEPQGRIARIGMEDLNDGELVVRVGYSNLNYKDPLAATGAGKIARRLPIVGGIDVAGTVIDSEDPRFDEGDEVLVTGFGLSEDRDGGYAEYARLGAEHAIKLPHGLALEEAMALGTAGLTAALSVARMEHNGLSPDKGPVAVTGATGGVGGVDLLGIDSDWCDIETRRGLWKRMARGGDLHPMHLAEMTRAIGFGELPDAFGALPEGGSQGRTVVRVEDG
jgi:acrylyl-CoA reductase (NADPH)